ncbi:MAG: PQQ-dependent sugar dehydrogenase [Crenarchaeota archaeon]|nr:MAG: PQQ-dependent sugar dehydrogenase [Thermoproteota archaeon]RDJ33504.1 MAG: PQQ-dependent sugar dehydrogenase [Thermoproteota archaeon]RDJ36072.1 MAG: PQQ-dependent sugar dehydrogenase [Thermoproteota archaeon]RDJ38177.1 MAG: PQQ-dependent sugar dehydrogenase [Thermoproteota archaeon]
MDKKLRIAGIIAALAASAIILTSPSDPLPIPEPNFSQSGNDSVEIIATNLEKPRAIDFADDRIFLTEKIGRVRVIQNNTLLEEPLATFRTANVFDGGLLGIATHPEFKTNNLLYVYYTYEEDGKLWNKVVQIKEKNNKLEDAITIIDKIPGSPFSNGGALKFGPDKKLYITTGSTSDSSHLPQDLDSLAGKVLRINDDGTIPNDNPFENSPVYSLGHRNPQGMTWDASGNLYVSDFGPTKNDEINLVIAGGNYGWPEQECSGNPSYIDSLICYDPAIEPGGILIYSGSKLPLEGKMIMASLRATNLYQLEFSEDGIESTKSILGGLGRIRDVAQDSNGDLYIITSNTDGKGFPLSTDDKLLRIVN